MNPYGDGLRVDFNPRCWRCNKLLIEIATQPWRIKCTRCKAVNQAGDVKSVQEEGTLDEN